MVFARLRLAARNLRLAARRPTLVGLLARGILSCVPRTHNVLWKRVAADLDRWGFARIPGVLGARECERLAALYRRDAAFRKTISMDAHRFGSGEYRYF